MSSTTGSKAKSGADQARAEAAKTRDDLAGTAAALADKADVKKATRRKAQESAAEVQQKADDVRGSVRKHPGRWGAAGAALTAAAGGVAGTLAWRRARRRRTPMGRAARMWHAVTDRFA
jgi:uncharacterized membrane protein YkoI